MTKRQKGKRKVSVGVAHINATFNNTLITIANTNGDVLCQSSAGACGFKGSRKGTPYAAQLAGEAVAKAAMAFEMKKVAVRISGGGAGRDSAIRALRATGLDVTELTDVTPLPHNGCRAPKKRRV